MVLAVHRAELCADKRILEAMIASIANLSSALSAEQKAHEPSMDEILASIRKIIADDDVLPLTRRPSPVAREEGARAGAGEGPTAAEPPAVAPAAPRRTPASSAQERTENVNAPTPTETPAAKPETSDRFLKEFRLRLGGDSARPASEDNHVVRPFVVAKDAAAGEAFKAELSPISLASGASARVSSIRPREEPQFAAPVEKAPETDVAPSVVAPVRQEAVNGPTLVFQAPKLEPATASQRVEAEDSRAAALSPEPAALVSAATDSAVGSAFGALAASVVMRDNEMIERLAREMLRPMLKNWLDDNLPIVVERLVRAEIERVARGGR